MANQQTSNMIKYCSLFVLLLVIVPKRWCLEEEFESEYGNEHMRFTVDVPIILYGKSYTEFHVSFYFNDAFDSFKYSASTQGKFTAVDE